MGTSGCPEQLLTWDRSFQEARISELFEESGSGYLLLPQAIQSGRIPHITTMATIQNEQDISGV